MASLSLLSCVLLRMQGSISFPIFVLHGAIGQLFYKKIVATKVRARWGRVERWEPTEMQHLSALAACTRWLLLLQLGCSCACHHATATTSR